MTALAGFLALGIIIGLIRGGSIAAIGTAQLRAPWLLLVALVLQLVANIPTNDLGFALVLASFTAVLAFAVSNIELPYMPVIAAGAFLNALVIGVNGGMPVSAEAIIAIGEDPTGLEIRGKHFLDMGTAHLRFLSDVIAWDLRPRIISVGDLVLWGGIALLVADLMRVERRPAREATD